MVGFPGETDAEFEETLALVRALPFGYLHLFPFSPRPGTRGWALHAERPVAPRRWRSGWLHCARWPRKRAPRTGGALWPELEAITLHTPARLAAQGRTAALTENFLPVELESRMDANRLVRLHITGMSAGGALVGCPMGADDSAAGQDEPCTLRMG